MPSIVTVHTFNRDDTADVAKIFQDFDDEVAPDLPRLRRRQVFSFVDLCVHLQDWDVADEVEAHRLITTDPRCTRLAEDLSAYLGEYTAPDTWDGPTDRPTATRFYLWPAEHLANLERTHSAVIVNTQRQEHIPEASRLFAASDATGFPHAMGTLRRQIYLYRGIYLHIQDFAEPDTRAVLSGLWDDPDPAFLQLVEDLKKIIPPYRPEAGALADRFYHWAAE